MALHLDLQTIINSAIAAGESSISVILVLLYGYLSNKTGLLTNFGEQVCYICAITKKSIGKRKAYLRVMFLINV